MVAAFDVFLSHHSGDKPWVIELKRGLVERGVRVWLDRDEIRPGDRFIQALAQGIESSACVAVIVSPRSLKSSWVMREYERAMALSASSRPDLRVIPCLRGEVKVPAFLGELQWVDFRDGKEFENRLDELCFGITGKPCARHDRVTSEPPQGEITARDLDFLDNSIKEVQKEMYLLSSTPFAAAFIGVACGLVWPQSAGTHLAIQYLGPAAVLSLLALAATTQRSSVARVELKRLRAHRVALANCLEHFNGVCPDVLGHFWNHLRQKIGISSAK